MKKFLLKILMLTLVPLLVFAATDKTQERIDYEVFKAQTEIKLDALKESQTKANADLAVNLDTAFKGQLEQLNHQVDWLGHLISISSIILTILMVVFGIFSYRNASTDAKNTAEEVTKSEVKTWFGKNANDVKQEIELLRKQLQVLEEDAKSHLTDLKRNTTNVANKFLRELPNHQHMGHVNENNDLKHLSDESNDLIRKGNQSESVDLISLRQRLQNKPSSEYAYDDWHTLAYITAMFDKNSLKASDYWRNASRIVNATDVEVAEALFNQAFALQEAKEFEKAIDVYQNILNDYSKNTDLNITTILLRSAVNLGQAYDAIGQYDLALETFDNYVKEYSSLIKFPGVEGEVASALIGKGIIYGRKGLYTKEIECYQQVIDDFKGGDNELVLDMVAHAMYYKGMSYSEFNDYDEAVNSFDEVINQFSNSRSLLLQKGVTLTLNYKAYVLILQAKLNYKNAELRKNRLNSAIELLNQALSREHNSDDEIAVQKGNLAYAQWLLLEEKNTVSKLLQDAFKLGGERLYKLTLEDVEKHTVDSDKQFIEIIDKIWRGFAS